MRSHNRIFFIWDYQGQVPLRADPRLHGAHRALFDGTVIWVSQAMLSLVEGGDDENDRVSHAKRIEVRPVHSLKLDLREAF